MLATIGWLFLVAVCVFFVCVGAVVFLLLGMFDQRGGEKWIGAIIFALALTGLYQTANISPFKIVNTHVHEAHK